MNIDKLRAAVRGRVFIDEETRAEVSTDFGRILEKTPRAVVLPVAAEDIQAVLRLANAENWSVSVRGAAHSQSGQCLSDGGVLIDASSLNRIDPPEKGTIRAESGVVWSDLVKTVAPLGQMPPVLTSNLNVTVGGTLSMAGLGTASHRHGAQVDNVVELEVVTGSGEMVCCSPQQNPDLFECMRAGLGQFGIITAARLKLRPLKPKVRTWFLLYDDLAQLMKDQERLILEDRTDFIESWCAPLAQGFRKVGEAKMPFAEWFYPMQLSWEYTTEADDQEVLAQLNHYKQVHCEESTSLDFAFRLEPVFQLWRQSGTWRFAHPWMEVMLPWEVARPYIEGVLKDFPPNLLIGGHVQLWPFRGATSQTPLFARPAGKLIMGFGILPAVPKQFLPMVLPMLRKASDLCIEMGGKRYLSSWVDFTPQQWKIHFGEEWSRLGQWKQFFDPQGVLNPGFIDYSVK